MLAMRRQTVLADARAAARTPPRSQTSGSSVRVSGFDGGYEWPNLPERARPRPRASAAAAPPAPRVGVEATIQPWLVVSTTWSREAPETKTAIPVGSVVRFTVQRGLKAVEDTSEMAILRGRVVAGRSTLLPDSYAVQAIDVVATHDLDSSVSTPPAGQVFLVAPSSVGAIESVGSESAKPSAPSTMELGDVLPQLTASAPPPGWKPPTTFEEAAGALGSLLGGGGTAGPSGGATDDGTKTDAGPKVEPSSEPGDGSLATEPADQSTAAVVIAVGAAVVVGIGLLVWRMSS